MRKIFLYFLFSILFLSAISLRVNSLDDLTIENKELYEFNVDYSEVGFLKALKFDKIRYKFLDKFKIFDEVKVENGNLSKENEELNKIIKDKLKKNKGELTQDVWRKIRIYKSEINDVKISTREKMRSIMSEEKGNVINSNYSESSISDFIDALIDAQNLKRDSIEFEKNYLIKIDELIQKTLLN